MNHFQVDIVMRPSVVQLLWSIHHARLDEYNKFTVGEDNPNALESEIPESTLDVLVLEPHKELNELAEKFPVRPTKMALFHLAPNAVIVPHVDADWYGRNTAVVFPLSSPFAPTIVYEDGNPSYTNYPDAYAFSTQAMHGVENNEHERLSLQLWFKENCDELKTLMV